MKEKQKAKDIKIIEYTIFGLVILLTLVGLVMGSIALSQYEKIPNPLSPDLTKVKGDLQSGVWALLTAFGANAIIIYLFFFELVWKIKALGTELSFRIILLIVGFFIAVTSMTLGILAFENRNLISY